MLVMCLVSGACAWASAKLSVDTGEITCIWISNAVISGFLLTARKGWRIPLFLAGQLVNFSVDLAVGDALPTAVWFSFCNSIEILVTVLPIGHFETRADLVNKRALLRIAYFGLFLGPLAGAVLAAPAIDLLQGRPLIGAMRVWFLSEALGAAVSIPLIVLLRTRERRRRQTWAANAGDIGLAALLVASGVAAFWQTRYPLLFLLFPPIVALIFRFRMDGAIIGTSAIAAIGAAFTAEGHGPFTLAPGTTIAQHVMLLQIFALVAFASCFPLGLVIEERHLLERALKLANEKLSELALRDGLTGVLNRRSFDALLDSEWSNACANQSALSLVYIDIDYFKRFNDSRGHQSGDDCLRSIADALVASVRGTADCVARYGGEEFVVILPGIDASDARSVADRINKTVVNLGIPHPESPFGIVTASVGVATLRPRHDGHPSELVRLADAALYAAKREGRNRIATNMGHERTNAEFAFN